MNTARPRRATSEPAVKPVPSTLAEVGGVRTRPTAPPLAAQTLTKFNRRPSADTPTGVHRQDRRRHRLVPQRAPRADRGQHATGRCAMRQGVHDMRKPGLAPAVTADASNPMSASTPPNPHNRSNAAQRAGRSVPASSRQAHVPAQPQRLATPWRLAALPGLRVIAPGQCATRRVPFTLSDKPLEARDAATVNATRRAVVHQRVAPARQQSAATKTSRRRAAPPAAMEATSSAPRASASSKANATAAEPRDTPELELTTIPQFMPQHREAAAWLRLQAFHRSYPQWRLPADVHALVGEP